MSARELLERSGAARGPENDDEQTAMVYIADT